MARKIVSMTRTISKWSVRDLCKEMEWYTNGTNEDFQMLLDMVALTKPNNKKALLAIAEDIQIHSDVPQDLDYLGHILWLIDRRCMYTNYLLEEC